MTHVCARLIFMYENRVMLHEIIIIILANNSTTWYKLNEIKVLKLKVRYNVVLLANTT